MAKKKEKKEKKAGKRMSKKQLAALLIDFFHAKQSETLSMKYIFSELHLTTHPHGKVTERIPSSPKEGAILSLWPNATRPMR